MKTLKTMTAILLALAMLLAGMAQAVTILSRGSKGDGVVALQQKLTELGYDIGKADGDFGGRTETALKQYQEAHGLEQTGKLDADTHLALFGEPLPMEAWEAPTASATGIHRYDYFVSDISWEEANRRAVDQGGWLVGINSLSEYVELQSEILELGYADVAFWIGARRDSDLGPGNFFWVDDNGATHEMPIDFDELLGGVNPWALGEPIARNAEGALNLFTRMRFSPGEARWVWENCDGKPQGRTGYIVEYPDESLLANLPPEAEVPVLTPVQEPEPQPTPQPTQGYDVTLLRLSAGQFLLRATTEAKCQFYASFQSEGGKEYCWAYDDIDAGLSDALVRADLFDGAEEYLPSRFIIKYRLCAMDPDTEKVIEGLTDWKICDLYAHEPTEAPEPEATAEPTEASEPEATVKPTEVPEPEAAAEPTEVPGAEATDEPTEASEPEATVEPTEVPGAEAAGRQPAAPPRKKRPDSDGESHRFTVVCISDPVGPHPGTPIEILDADTQDPVIVTVPGEPGYLLPGTYIIRVPGVDGPDTPFTVLDSPVMPVIMDMAPGGVSGTLVDSATGKPLAGVTVTVEVQGVTYTTTTDENGRFAFENLPPVEAMLTVRDVGVATRQQRFTVGAGVDTAIDLEVEPYPRAAFFGIWHDGSAEADAAMQAFWDSAESFSWAIGHTMYIEVVQGAGNGAPAPGTLLECQSDASYAYFNNTVQETREDFFASPDVRFSPDDGLLYITGVIRPNNLKANNSHWDYVFEGWSDLLIDDFVMEPVADAGRRLLAESLERGVDPLSDEGLRAIVAQLAGEDALAGLEGLDPDALSASLEKLLK